MFSEKESVSASYKAMSDHHRSEIARLGDTLSESRSYRDSVAQAWQHAALSDEEAEKRLGLVVAEIDLAIGRSLELLEQRIAALEAR